MASSFAAQLRTIAQNSTHELDLRARRTAHTESLLFPKEIAVKQTFDAIFAVCSDGFRELCSLDPAFIEFERNLFSAQSVRTDREQMNKSENEALDRVLERCLTMLGARVMLKPGVKCLEWLVRRFRVHVYNSAALLLGVLPWHEMGIWKNVLSIVPKEKCIDEWRFLGMYKEDALNVPRSAVVYTAANNDGFFALFNNYAITASKSGIAYSGMLRFWSGITIEAVLARLDAARSGKKEIQRQRMQDLLLKTLPILSEGFEIEGSPDLITACYTLAVVLASKANLDDRVVDSLLQAIAGTVRYPGTEAKAAIVTMAILVSEKQVKSVPRAVLDTFVKTPDLETVFKELADAHSSDALIEALVNTAHSTTKKKYIPDRLAFTERLLRLSDALPERQLVSAAAKAVLTTIIRLNDATGTEGELRNGLIELLQRLNGERTFSLAISEASNLLHQDTAQLEALLGSTIGMVQTSLTTQSDAMELDSPVTQDKGVQDILDGVPSRTVDTTSFLAHHDQHLYDQLVDAFKICSLKPSNLHEFFQLPIWSSNEAPLLESFLLRIGIGPFQNAQKITALQLLAYHLQKGGNIDAQSAFVYVLTALSNSSQAVRQAAADLLVAVRRAIPAGDVSDLSSLASLYADSQEAHVSIATSNNFERILDSAFLPVLEECVLDATQIRRTTKAAICGPSEIHLATSSNKQTELKKSLRQDLFNLLSSHANKTPLLHVKINTIELLDGVNKVGSITKSRALAPMLTAWSVLDQDSASRKAAAEGLLPGQVDSVMMRIISAQDKDALGQVVDILEDKNIEMRIDLVSKLFERLQELWNESKHDTQGLVAQRLFDLAFASNPALARGAQGVLRSVKLSTTTLGSLLELAAGKIVSVQNDEQPKKKRRTSHGKDSVPLDLARMMRAAFSRLTLMLEILDSAGPETKPELVPVLFDVLSLLRRLGQQQRIDSPYLLNLCLGSILAISQAQERLPRPTIDVSSIRTDLVTDCVRSSGNPQVQSTALLLSASLASLVPDRVLHNVMPIFTFMGQNTFTKEDEHSIYVVNQAVDQIIPALVDSFREQNKDLVKSVSSLLASFTAAFDHMPQHRRVPTYSRLLDRMGADDFAFVLFAMLASRKGHQPAFATFFTELVAELDADVQVVTVHKLMELVGDLLSAKPQISEEVFGATENTSKSEKQRVSKAIFKISILILESTSLQEQVRRLHKLDEGAASRLRSHFNGCLRQVLLTVNECKRDNHTLVDESRKCLDALLALPSLKELLTTAPQVLTNVREDEDLMPQVLRVLASQIQGRPTRDGPTRHAAISLLKDLTEMLQTETIIAIKQALIVCIDRLSETYGKKDVQVVVAAATVIAGGSCLASDDPRLYNMSLLCLASMLEVMREACVPIVPQLLPTSIKILRGTLQRETEAEGTHNAACALIAAAVSHVPFLLSDEHLQTLLVLYCASAAKYESTTASDARKEVLSLLARKIELKTLSETLLGEPLDASRENPERAELEILDMLSMAIDNATKAVVVRDASVISQILLAHLDQRARLSEVDDVADDATQETIRAVESKINEISINFIYKLNDTAFRPIFESWVEWAVNAPDKADSMNADAIKISRQTSLFNNLTFFFDTLKSIVTSYATYIVSHSHTTLSSFIESKENRSSREVDLYSALLKMLRSAFAHDADGFFATPSHFEPLAAPLVAQLKLASSKAHRSILYSSVIPTIVALATATIDTPAHHQSISHELVQLRNSSSAPVRLASIKTLAAVTDDEAVGEDFIANVIGIGSGEGEGARGIGGGGSVGEIMIYVNEMLEDDDEEVEREVRRWVQRVREKTGEDVFEV